MVEKLYPPEGDVRVDARRIDHPSTMPDGIYFNLDEDRYHAAFALSSSGIKHLRISAENFWAASILNPDREEDEPGESFAKTLGKAYHKRIVEGREAFARCYAPEIEAKDYRGCLITNDDLKKRLKELDKPVGGNKAELVARVIDADPGAQIWDVLVAQHEARYPNRVFLAWKYIKRIEYAAAMIENDPQLGKAFAGGVPEVSIFYHDADGIPRKARLDYLKTRAIVDLKSFDDRGVEVKRAIIRAISSYKYFIQAAFYFQAVEAAKELIRNGDIFVGDTNWAEVDKEFCPPTEFLQALTAPGEHKFLFCFQQKNAGVSRGILFPRDHSLVRLGEIEIEMACSKFLEMWERFGAERWVDPKPIEELSADEFPAWVAD